MAVAGDRLGIGIRRHFTTEGVHPYDEVEWERRDSRITDYRDGSVAFEQLGVEVPKTWSMNATNILAQKYFRGTLGTPEREWSLRQVVDRVVGSITRWGQKDGYFVDDAEAEAFAAELAHIIVNQKAAFNSPVWFNIGVAGVPQQAAACFILSVEDQMDSILNWYVEEGTIFKGGSGAGTNLSRIRSSKELLAGGGTASGPVSFMRGADASAGTIKSGGKTRRAAKMVILDADHPDIQEFVWCKAREERKARVLSGAGFDMDLDGVDSHSLQYQNANNSVRVTDEFMQAVLDDAEWSLVARTTGQVLERMPARDLFRQIAEAAWECADPGLQYDTTINKWHTAPHTGRINASNPCSEYVHLDNSSCNLASINLLTFLEPDGSFDVEGFKATVEVVFTAQEILVGNADYPTQKIGDTTRRFRQLGLGYANLGALLMAEGIPYDSEAGRAWAGAITALMTGHAYAVSARTAARMGPFAGYHENAEPMLDVLRMHRAEVARIDEELVPTALLSAAQEAWDCAVDEAEIHGVRNSQATVLAPTGCLVPGTLVLTERGLVRLGSLGNSVGPTWQDLQIAVATDEGSKTATKFYVNGLSPVASLRTARGYGLRGTPQHRVKVVQSGSGALIWRHLGDLRPGDIVPVKLGGLVGDPQQVTLPPAPDAYWTSEHDLHVPRTMTPELSELVGYFMGDGSLHSRGLRFCVTNGDDDVATRLELLGKELFGLSSKVTPRRGYMEVRFDSVRLTLWWEACGFSKRSPVTGHRGKGFEAHVPDAVLNSNDPEVYRAFVRGLFEADGDTSAGYPTLRNTSIDLVEDVQTILLALGYPTTRSVSERTGAWGNRPLARLRLLNLGYCERWRDEIDFIGSRKSRGLRTSGAEQAARKDRIPFTREMADRIVPTNGRLRRVVLMELARNEAISRRIAQELHATTGDPELGHLLGFFYDRVEVCDLAEEEPTYDLSVPENVTYLANGFVSHNTISFLMDCDTTGIEPDLGLVKTKKLVGGGTMSIVNQTIPRALRRLGYGDAQVAEIVAHIDEHKSIVGAPHLRAEHLPVFACSMGDNTIHYTGHVKMMAAAQPFISGAISKCVIGSTLLTTTDGLVRIGTLHDGEGADSYRHAVIGVASVDGVQKTDAFYYGGLRKVREVVLRSGHRVTGTPNHRVLVAGEGGLEWRRLDELAAGDPVAVQYGADLWSVLPARFDDFVPSPRVTSQKRVRVPAEMTEELAMFLGAYAAEGHTTRSNWTITITNSVDSVLERVADAAEHSFGVRPPIRRPANRCASLELSSKTVVEFLDHLGCGDRASSKRIPDSVLRSPRSMVLSFLRGLALDAYVTVSTAPKWAICLDSPALLDDLQAVLTNLGLVSGRVAKYNPRYDKTYDEVYVTGRYAKDMVVLVPFLEPDKADRAAALLARRFANAGTADLVPGISPTELLSLVPYGRRNEAGLLLRTEFGFLADPRTKAVSRETVRRVGAIPGVVLPPWLRMVLDDGLHFSPVSEVSAAGLADVFDMSVPETHAFVGNGIMNHNTVNMPEDVSVEDVEQLHVDAWRMGLKAIAIYRDNCKVAQPLSTTKKESTAAPAPTATAGAGDPALLDRIAELEAALQARGVDAPAATARKRLPRRRNSKTFAFRVADCEGYVTVGEYEDGHPGEVFMKVSKQGSTLSGIMDAFSIAVSLGLQHGVPLSTFVRKYTNMRFEPAGITDDADLRLASSLVDYIFRRLALDYLDDDERMDLGVLSTTDRMQPTLPGLEETYLGDAARVEREHFGDGGDSLDGPPRAGDTQAPATGSAMESRDAPFCYACGNVMQRAGSCYACPSCGATSGCS